MINKKTLSEQVAETIRDEIIAGKYNAGASLPTEPELADLFKVSRSVIRDAVRILFAWGLIRIEHGRGMYITESQENGLSQALLIALQRDKASVWDISEFERLLYPSLVELAAKNHKKEDTPKLLSAMENYLDAYTGLDNIKTIHERFLDLMFLLCKSSGNKVVIQIARPLLKLRNLNSWLDDDEISFEMVAEIERKSIEPIIKAVCSNNPSAARQAAEKALTLPPEAAESMKKTLIGEIVEIPLTLKSVIESE